MIINKRQTIKALFSLLLALPLLTACSGVKFAEETVSTSSISSSSACTERDVAGITRMTKILFLVDTSGSNVLRTRLFGTQQCFSTDSDWASCAMPTDPSKSFRGGVIQNFLNSYGSKANFQWGFINFAGDSAHALIKNWSNDQSPYLSPNASDMQTAINQFYGVIDDLATPYQAALELAKRAIQNDRDLNSAANPQYFVVMLTDGFPTDYNALNGAFDFNAVQSDIVALKGIAPGRVSLSTIYYGANNPNALSLLQSMAQIGNGQFASVNDSSTSVKIDNVLPGTRVCD